MKYLEELKPGDLFSMDKKRFILTGDFKSTNDQKTKKMSIDIETGFVNWLIEDSVVELLDLYYRDRDGNILALKEHKNEYTDKTPNIS
jgi:hypothetical protein